MKSFPILVFFTVMFFTLSCRLNGQRGFVDQRDGRIYKAVKIGSQTWMAENLAWLPEVSPSSEEAFDKPHYYVYNFNGRNVDSAKSTPNYAGYGVLYNWEAAKAACPAGWRLPDDEDWMSLEMYLGMNLEDIDNGFWRSSGDVGRKLKSGSGWSPDADGVKGDNSSRFTAIPAGIRVANGGFYGLFGKGDYAYFWSASEAGEYSAWFRCLYRYTGPVGRGNDGKTYGFSVRCLKNDINSKNNLNPATLTNNTLSKSNLNNVNSLSFSLGFCTYLFFTKDQNHMDCRVEIDAIKTLLNELGVLNISDSILNQKKNWDEFKTVTEDIADNLSKVKGEKAGNYFRIKYYISVAAFCLELNKEKTGHKELMELYVTAASAMEQGLKAANILGTENSLQRDGKVILEEINNIILKGNIPDSITIPTRIREWEKIMYDNATQIILKRN